MNSANDRHLRVVPAVIRALISPDHSSFHVLEDLIGVLDHARVVARNIQLVPFVGDADAGGVGPVPSDASPTGEVTPLAQNIQPPAGPAQRISAVAGPGRGS